MFKGAFWLSPQGEFIKTEGKHINEIVRNPARFGFTEEQLREIFQRHGEPYGHEGMAREEIIEALISRGWVRFRLYPNRYWSITVSTLRPRGVRRNIQQWAELIRTIGIDGVKEQVVEMPVRIVELNSEQVYRDYTVDDLRDGVLGESNEECSFTTLVESELNRVRDIYNSTL